MNKSNTAKLYLACPIIFRDNIDCPERTFRFWGFECGDGWFETIYDLSVQIEYIALALKNSGVSIELLPKASQVKEKFGSLRFYMANSTKEIERLIEHAQAVSVRTCESCGNPGQLLLLDSGWMVTLCEACKETENA